MKPNPILIFGASGGIGRAIVENIIKLKLPMILTGRNKKELLELEKKVSSQGIFCKSFILDLAKKESIKKLAAALNKKSLSPNWIINAHGYIETAGNLVGQDIEELESSFQINFISNLYIMKFFLPFMVIEGGIINISSSAALKPNGKYAVYSASKAALDALSQAVATSINFSENKNISIFSVCPGPTNTPMRKKISKDTALAQDPKCITDIIDLIIQKKSNYKNGDIIIVKDCKEELVSSI